MELKDLTAADIEFVRVLRNAYREMFTDKRHVSRQQQLDWFKTIEHRYSRICIIWDEWRRVGVVSLMQPRDDGAVEIGPAMVSPSYMHDGIVARFLRSMLRDDTEYFGKIITEPHYNYASARMLMKIGFTARNAELYVRSKRTERPET